jgi:hypothetical protein
MDRLTENYKNQQDALASERDTEYKNKALAQDKAYKDAQIEIDRYNA